MRRNPTVKRGIRRNSKWKKYQRVLDKLRKERAGLIAGNWIVPVIKRIDYETGTVTFRREWRNGPGIPSWPTYE